jgi:hypothetical protein
LERKRKAQAFLAQIMADKRAAREAQQRAHQETLRHEQNEEQQKQVAAAKSDSSGFAVSGCERPPVALSPSRRRRRCPSPEHRSAARSTRRRERSPSPVDTNVSRKRSKRCA